MALVKMDPDYGPTLSQAHPETMDFLSNTWCNFAVHALQHEAQERSLVLHDNSMRSFENDSKSSPPPPLPAKMDKSSRMDDGDKFVPNLKANDVKSWIWMQQAMHPEVNYSSYFKRKWIPWKIPSFKNTTIKKWLKETRQRRKEDQRLQNAEVHAAISVAGVAAALAALASENSGNTDQNSTKQSAVAAAAALVAAQCAKVAEAMGADRDHLKTVISSAVSGNSASDIVTLTAAATTSIRGADTLKARSGYKNRMNGSSPVLPIEDSNEADFDFEKCRLILAKGTEINIENSDGSLSRRSVTIILNHEGKVVLKMKKLNLLNALSRQKESNVVDMHTELYKDSETGETETGYVIVLTTDKGIQKLDLMNDYQRYRTWSMTINHMLMLSATFTKYELQFCKK